MSAQSATVLRHVPNLLTAARIVASIGVFLAIAYAAGAAPFQAGRPTADMQTSLLVWSAAAFALAALTDYFDGWLARKLHAQSVWGAILDPIADKIAVGGVIVALCALKPTVTLVVAGGLILFRELFVSGLREVGAARGVTFPVTMLAKWKTTFQLVALVAQMIALALFIPRLQLAADALMWIAAALTVWTGGEYAAAAVRGLAQNKLTSEPGRRR